MRDQLIAPLEDIVSASQVLLADTSLNVHQEKIVQSIHGVAFDMFGLTVSIPDLTWDRAREIFSFESRSHLASIIGYAEALLEGEEGPLDDGQQEQLTVIWTNGKQLYDTLTEILDDAHANG
jgi:hypothetical protein